MRVLRFFIFFRKLRIRFWDFSNFNEIWKYGFEISKKNRACGAQIDAFLKEIVDLPLKYPKIFACGAKICIQGFEFFRKLQNFETNVLRFFKNFQISSQGFKVLSLKFPNLGQWFWDFSPAAQFAQGVLTEGRLIPWYPGKSQKFSSRFARKTLQSVLPPPLVQTCTLTRGGKD